MNFMIRRACAVVAVACAAAHAANADTVLTAVTINLSATVGSTTQQQTTAQPGLSNSYFAYAQANYTAPGSTLPLTSSTSSTLRFTVDPTVNQITGSLSVYGDLYSNPYSPVASASGAYDLQLTVTSATSYSFNLSKGVNGTRAGLYEGATLIAGPGPGNTTGVLAPGVYDIVDQGSAYPGSPLFSDQFTLSLGGPVSVAVAPVPLPPAGWLLGTGLIGLVGLSRRRGAA